MSSTTTDHGISQAPEPSVTKPSPVHKPHNRSSAENAPVTVEPLQVEQDATNEDVVYPSGSKFAALLAAFALSLVMVGLDNMILSVAIPAITMQFKTIADIGWYMSAYRLTGCSFQFMFGKMYTLFSIKTVFLVSLAIFECGSVLCASAPTSKALVLGRAVAGLGTSGIIMGVFAMVTQSVPLRRRSLYGGAGAAIEELASLSAPLLGGILTEKLSWRWNFWINLPLGILTFIVTIVFFQNPTINKDLSLPLREKLRRLDILGSVLFVPAISSLLLALQWGGAKYGWANARIITLFIAFGLLITLFGYLQHRRGDLATLPPRILKQRSIASGALFSLCNNAALAIVDYYMPIYMQIILGKTPSQSGILTLPSVLGLAIALLFSGTFTTVIGHYAPSMLLTSFLTPIAAGLLTTLEPSAKLASLICYQALLGFGAGIGFQAPQIAVQTILTPQEAPMGLAFIQFAQGIGPAVFVSVAQTIFAGRLTSEMGQYTPGLDAGQLKKMGLADLKNAIGPENLQNVIMGYDKAVTQTFYLPVALTCVSILGSLGMEWRSVKKKRA